MPYPSKARMGEIVGKDKSTIQKHLRQMENQGLLKRKKRFQHAGGQTSNEYDLSGLIQQLSAASKKELKAQMKQNDDVARKRRGHIL